MPPEQINAIRLAAVALDDSLEKFEKLSPEKQEKARKKWQKLIKVASAKKNNPKRKSKGG